MSTKRLLVCGGRHYEDAEAVWRTLDTLKPGLLIEGGASGADKLAKQWAEHNGVPCMEFPAMWKRYGRAAGSIRNRWMLAYGRPDAVMAFPGGPGTKNMIKQANDAGIDVYRLDSSGMPFRTPPEALHSAEEGAA